jgi:enoyl-[acyl-carrier-protein] reductase (NADH)
MENLKLPIALVAGMAIQLAGGVWWVSQQAATIASLEETVSQLGSKMAIEDNVNLRRDVAENKNELEDVWDDIEGLSMSIGAITELKQRVALLETELKFISRDHDGVLMNNHPNKQ